MKIAGATMALAAGLLELSLVLGAAVEKRQMPGSAKSEDIVSQRMCYWGSPESMLPRFASTVTTVYHFHPLIRCASRTGPGYDIHQWRNDRNEAVS